MKSLNEIFNENNQSRRIDYTYCAKCDCTFDKNSKICPKCSNVLMAMQQNDFLDNRAYLVKFSDVKAIQSMRCGEIWFRPPQYYRNLYVNNPVAGDIQEFVVNRLDGTINNIEYDTEEKGKVLLCLYSLMCDKFGEYKISKDEAALLRKFGSHASVIHQKKFFAFLNKQKKRIAEKICCGSVIYYVKNKTGYITPFWKREDYLYQHEYRIILQDRKFYDLYAGENLIENKYVFRSPYNLKKVFSCPIPIDVILENTNVKCFEDHIKFV